VKIKLIGTITVVILSFIILSPSINAIVQKEKKESPLVKQYFDLQPNEESIKTENPKPFNFGFIHGDTMWAKGWACGILRFVKIVAKGESYSRTKTSGLFGIYFLFVPLNKEISITASKMGHETETKKVTLTHEKRLDYVGFMLNVL